MAGNDFERFDRNRIIFGAPGTGKSFGLSEDAKVFGDQVESNRESFKKWLSSESDLKELSIQRYITALNNPSEDIYSIKDAGKIAELYNETKNKAKSDDSVSNKDLNNLSSVLKFYKKFIAEKRDFYVERVIFYSNYSYSQFDMRPAAAAEPMATNTPEATT